jgi:S-layer protein (TIGR01567 family)
MMLLLATAMVVGAVDKVEVRGAVQTVVDGSTPTWDPQTFAGFYYDIDDALGNENIKMAITGNKLEEPTGVTYTTTSQLNDFDFEDWGWYNSIGFLGENYFAGYSEKKPVVNGEEIEPELWKHCTDKNTLTDEQLLKVLKDDDTEMTVTSGTPLKLEEGYELSIKSIDIDGNKVYLELSKDGSVISSKVISPSKDGATMADKTYYYKKDIGDTKEIVIVAAHFKNAFRGADQNLATVDGIFQVSDTASDVAVDTEYDKMRISSVSQDTISMDNKDNSITLSKNKETALMAGIGIRTADQDNINDTDPLRFYLYKEMTEPGTYELRGQVQTVVDGSNPTWDPKTFSGFYYDIDDNLGNENIKMTITGNKLEEPTGVAYTTTTQLNDLDFEDWGWYNSIGFLGENYFAGYSEKKPVVNGEEIEPELWKHCTDKNTLTDEQLLKVLKDDDTEMTVTSGTPLKLEEGYELSIKSIDIDGNKVYLELSKDGSVISSKVISPSKDGATMADKTYYYKKDIGDTKEIVIVAAHFKNAFRGADQNLATVDGIFQVSDTASDVAVDTEYDKMRISAVSPDTITMDNKDNSITLSKNKETALMAGIGIKTADQDNINDTDPLRFYIFNTATIEGAETKEVVAPEVTTVPEETPVVEAPPVAPVAANETNVTEVTTPAETTNVTPAQTTTSEAEKKNETTTPGFESVFAITGLLAVAYLVLGRRE